MILRPLSPFTLSLCFMTLAGCGGTTSEVVTDPKIDRYNIVNIAVMPFAIERPTLGQERGYAAPAPPLAASETLADIFYRKLKSRDGINVIDPYQVNKALAEVPEKVVTKSVIRSVGVMVGAGAVLVGSVDVYKERAGSAMGLDRPQDAAEVGFAVQLISVKDGVALWTGEYHERQRPANEDIRGFLERGPRFVTVDQLADSAADHVLRKFPFGEPRKKDSSTSGTQ
jgi:hypothetical protein